MKNQELLEKGLEVLVSRLESTEAFVMEKAPEICKEMLYREIGGCTFDTVLNFAWATMLLVVAFLCCYFAYTYTPKNGYISVVQIVSCIAAFVSGISSVCFFYGAIYSAKYTYFTKKCPKLFLLREFSRLVKNKE